jgi:hypothetical protein
VADALRDICCSSWLRGIDCSPLHSLTIGPKTALYTEVSTMIHCTDLIRALEQYCRGYGDRANIERLLAIAQRNQEDPRVFAWQRDRLATLVAQVQASREASGESIAFPRSPVSLPAHPEL